MGLAKEFKEFSLKGSFVDMAGGIIVGAAVGKVVTSLVNDVIMPAIGMLLGRVDFKNFEVCLKEKVVSGTMVADPGVYIRVGAFANTLLEFLIITFCIFMMLKAVNRARETASTVVK